MGEKELDEAGHGHTRASAQVVRHFGVCVSSASSAFHPMKQFTHSERVDRVLVSCVGRRVEPPLAPKPQSSMATGRTLADSSILRTETFVVRSYLMS